jgi:sterol 3beta-glucosyltransferase
MFYAAADTLIHLASRCPCRSTVSELSCDCMRFEHNLSSDTALLPLKMASPTATSPLAIGPRHRHPPSHLHMSLNASSPDLAASMPNLPAGDSTTGRAPNRLRKKRKDGPYLPAMDIPDHLKETKEEAGREEDVRASRSGGGGMNMHQSIFGLIAAAGSRVDFQDRFEDEESEDEGESIEGAGTGKSLSQLRRQDAAGRLLAVPHRHNSDGQQSGLSEKGDEKAKSEKKHRRKITDGIMRSVPVLKRLSSRSKKKPSKRDSMAESQILERDEPTDDDSDPRGRTMQLKENESDNDRHVQPVMSRMLEARAAAASRRSVDLDRLSTATPTLGDAGTLSSAETTDLAVKLKEIFEFDEVEAVVDGRPLKPRLDGPRPRRVVCWLTRAKNTHAG